MIPIKTKCRHTPVVMAKRRRFIGLRYSAECSQCGDRRGGWARRQDTAIKHWDNPAAWEVHLYVSVMVPTTLIIFAVAATIVGSLNPFGWEIVDASATGTATLLGHWWYAVWRLGA